jgi:23S rRNA pseudouridine2605 synthase
MQPETETPGKERIQKILARAGFGSRRACEELIVDGRVTLNGETVSVLGATADASRDTIAVDGERVRMPQFSYWIANKPEGVAVSERDAERFVQDVIPGEHPRVFTVGRLDKGSCGLMFVTNDGARSEHPHSPALQGAKIVPAHAQGRSYLRHGRAD